MHWRTYSVLYMGAIVKRHGEVGMATNGMLITEYRCLDCLDKIRGTCGISMSRIFFISKPVYGSNQAHTVIIT